MPSTDKTPFLEPRNTLGIAALTLAGGAAVAAIVAKKRSQTSSISGYAVKRTIQDHKPEEPIYILLGGQKINDEFHKTLDSWLSKFRIASPAKEVPDPILMAYCVSVSESVSSDIEKTVSQAIDSNRSKVTRMAKELSDMIAESTKHSNRIIVQCYQGTEKLGQKALMLLPADIRAKVELLSLGATLK